MNNNNTQNKKFYVTTSIPYVNDKPHIGHLLEFIQADVLARYHRSIGDDTFLLTGTDEHGQKIFEAAKDANSDVKKFAAKNSELFLEMAKMTGMSNDYFVRTTDDRHKIAAQKIWKACADDIYKGLYSGLYCTGCEQYYTSRETINEQCPIHKVKLKELEMESYFFRLSKYQNKLIELISSNQLNIIPDKRRNEMLQFAKKLEDVSISRPVSELNWGVEVPDDPSHVMYVWFDALTNYISAVGYADDIDLFEKYWPANMHVIGKDIARQHCLLWPAMLLSAGEKPPQNVYVHGFIQSGNQKMSKSLGNVVDPIQLIKKYGVDAVRYYLLRYIPYDNDGDFTEERFIEVYNADLANNLGNLVARTATMLTKYCDGTFKDTYTPVTIINGYQQKNAQISGTLEQIDHCAFNKYLDSIFNLLDAFNRLIEEKKPWQLVKSDTKATQKLLGALANELLSVANSLEPFMPETATKIIKTFKDGKVDSSVGILFPRID